MKRGLYAAPSLARVSHVGRKIVCRFQIEQPRQEGTLAGRSKKSILQLKPWKTYSHKRSLKKRSSPKIRLSKTGAYSKPLKSTLQVTSSSHLVFLPNLITFPFPAIIALFAFLPIVWGPLTCALHFCAGNMDCFPRFFPVLLASLFFFPQGIFPLVCLWSVTPAALFKTRNTRADLLPRVARIRFWMNDRQASPWWLHFTDPAAAFQDEVLTTWLIMEDTGINTALRSLSRQLELQWPLVESEDDSQDQAD